MPLDSRKAKKPRRSSTRVPRNSVSADERDLHGDVAHAEAREIAQHRQPRCRRRRPCASRGAAPDQQRDQHGERGRHPEEQDHRAAQTRTPAASK
jgi:hypothetical protein